MQIIQILIYCEVVHYKLVNIKYVYYLPIVSTLLRKKFSLVNLFYHCAIFFFFSNSVVSCERVQQAQGLKSGM